MSIKLISKIKEIILNSIESFLPFEEAEYFADNLIRTHIKKYPRTNPITDAIKDIKSWQELKDSKLEIEVDKPSSLLLNFNNLAPSLKLKYIHDELEERCKNNGIAIVAIRNSKGFHTLNFWTDSLADRNLIGICMYNGGPLGVIPFGGTQGLLGTNPISYSIPTANSPITADFATSEIPYFDIVESRKNGNKLPEKSAVNSKGEFTTDPLEAMDEKGISNLTPLGANFKGYSLNLLIEILTGSFVNSLLSNKMNPNDIENEHGGLIIGFDASVFTDINKFKGANSELANSIRSQKPTLSVHKVQVPGDRSNEKFTEMQARQQMELDEKTYNSLFSIISENRKKGSVANRK